MKHFILAILLVFTSVLTYAQSAPEKANAIIITMPDSATLNDKITKVLTSKDYTVNKGKAPILFTTSAKTLKNNTRVVLNVQTKGADIILTGVIAIAGQAGMKIENKGAKGTPLMIAWEEMDKVAKAFGGKLKYETK